MEMVVFIFHVSIYVLNMVFGIKNSSARHPSIQYLKQYPEKVCYMI